MIAEHSEYIFYKFKSVVGYFGLLTNDSPYSILNLVLGNQSELSSRVSKAFLHEKIAVLSSITRCSLNREKLNLIITEKKNIVRQ